MAKSTLVLFAVSAASLAGCASAGQPYAAADEGLAGGPPVVVQPGAVPGLCCAAPAPAVTYAAPPAPAYQSPPAYADGADQGYQEGAQAYAPAMAEGGYAQQGAVSGGYESRSFESRSYAETHAVEVRRYEQQYFERQRYTHHTVDRYGYLNWAGKTTDYGPGGPEGAAYTGETFGAAAYGVAAGCPVGQGVRVLSCQYIPFAPPAEEASLSIHDEDFAYEGGAGPIGVSGGGGGGGGEVEGFGSGSGFGSGFSHSSASASASASASVSASVSISSHMHGGYGGGGYHGGGHTGGWGGHMGGGSSSCGCKHK